MFTFIAAFLGPIGKLLGPIGKFLKEHWKLVLAIVFIFGCFKYVDNLNDRISDLNDDVSEWRQKYTDEKAAHDLSKLICDQNQKTFENAIEEQNQLVESLRIDLDGKQSQIDQAADKIKQQQIEHKIRIEKLKNEIVPQTCDGVIEYMVDKAGELQW